MKYDVSKVWTTPDGIWVELTDGTKGFEKFADYPRLRSASDADRNSYEVTPFGLRWDSLDEDLGFEGFFSAKERTPLYDFFLAHPELNASAIARSLNISQSLFAQYISGHKQPSEERLRMINNRLRSIGQALLEVSF